MNRYPWKIIVIGLLIEIVLLGASVVLGIRIGRQLATAEQNTVQQKPRSDGRQGTYTAQDAPPVESSQISKPIARRSRENHSEQERRVTASTGPANTNAADTRAESQSVNHSAPRADSSAALRDLPTSYFVIAGSLALVVLILTLYFLVLVPRKKRRPMLEAFALINNDSKEDLSKAEQLLGVALTNGMRVREIADARFALAYVRARLGRFADAAAVVADLIASGRQEREIIYLDLWLQSRLKDDEKAIRIYEEHATTVGDLLDGKLIAAIAFLRRARFHWTHREIASALHYFEELRKLGVLTEEIPSHVDDHEVLIGLVSLFDHNTDEARKHFEGAVTSARGNSKPTTHGELGLLLCKWRATDHPDIDNELGRVLAELTTDTRKDVENVFITCKFCDKKYKVRPSYVGQPVSCTDCKRRFIVELSEPGGLDNIAQQNGHDSEAEVETLLNDDDLLLRNVLLWHAVALLFTWRSFPPLEGLPEGEYEVLCERLAKIREIDPELPDADLLAGLIAYYFLHDDQKREEAVELLDKSIANGVNVPEVLDLVDREQRLTELQRDSLNRYLVLVRNYLADNGVPEHFRQQLKEQLEQFSRFKQLGEIDLIKGEVDAMPSVSDVQSRIVLLGKRVDQIVKPRLVNAEVADREAIEVLIKRLNRTTKVLSQKVTTLEKTEYGLMKATGEFFLREDEDAEQFSDESVEVGES